MFDPLNKQTDTMMLTRLSVSMASQSHINTWKANNNNNNNNIPICKAPECQKTSVALAGQEQSCELNRIKSPT